ncbi:hypothetical protein MTO96_006907 [Rhipicephalus appendiculatus]
MTSCFIVASGGGSLGGFSTRPAVRACLLRQLPSADQATSSKSSRSLTRVLGVLNARSIMKNERAFRRRVLLPTAPSKASRLQPEKAAAQHSCCGRQVSVGAHAWTHFLGSRVPAQGEQEAADK